MQITDFFDAYNVEHVRAYKHLRDTGSWPEGFIPEDCELHPSWSYQVASKLANAYIDAVLTEYEETS